MVKLFLLLILCFLIHGEGSEERRTPDDLPDLTAPESIISREKLDQLNKLRKDVLKSLMDLQSQMVKKEDYLYVGYMLTKSAWKDFMDDSENITDDSLLYSHIVNTNGVINGLLDDGNLAIIRKHLKDESDKNKFTDFMKNVMPDVLKRMEPFESSLFDEN